MGESTKIQWCHHSFNLVIGCTKVSEACHHCYAESFSKRIGLKVWGPNAPRKILSDDYWRQPLKWNEAAAREGVSKRVFCSSLADVFEDHPTVAAQRLRLWPLIAATPHLDWLLLTKRPENMIKFAPPEWEKAWPDNVWAGCTVENQERADERVPWIVCVPAVVRFLSIEPLLGDIDLENIHPYYLKRDPSPHDPIVRLNCLTGHVKGPDDMTDEKIQWVIIGGESGHGSRPFNIQSALRIIAACKAAGVACFCKQLGAKPDRLPYTLRDKKGGDIGEWPLPLRVRQFPKASRHTHD